MKEKPAVASFNRGMRNKKSAVRILTTLGLTFLLVLLVLPATGCTPTYPGEIKCLVTLNGEPWSGPISFTIVAGKYSEEEAAELSGLGCDVGFSGSKDFSTVPSTLDDTYEGIYTISYKSGGPQGAGIKFAGIRCGGFLAELDILQVTLTDWYDFDTEETYTDKATVYFTFVSTGDIVVNATLDGQSWSGQVNYKIEGPAYQESAVTVPPNVAIRWPKGSRYSASWRTDAVYLDGEIVSTNGQIFDYYINGGYRGSVPLKDWNFFNEAAGITYKVAFSRWQHQDAVLQAILPSDTQQVLGGERAHFTFVFVHEENLDMPLPEIREYPSSGLAVKDYTIEGSSVAQIFDGLPAGTYSVVYDSGGPEGAVLQGISPSAEQGLSANDTATFTFEFISTSEIAVDALLDGKSWQGNVSCTIEGPDMTNILSSVPQDLPECLCGEYSITYNYGGPLGAVLSGISPSATAMLSPDEATRFTLNFVSVGDIAVNATLDGVPWSGEVDYTLQGPEIESGASAPQTFSELPIGSYTIVYNSGGPLDAILSGISPLNTEELTAGETAIFTLDFISVGDITVNATLDGVPWSGEVDYTLQGPKTESGASAPQTFSELPIGTYTLTYNSGGPQGALLSSISPSTTQELLTGETITFILRFISPPPPEPAPQADLSLTKTVDNATPNEGDTITYTITVTNSGPDNATNVQITDALPEGVAYTNDTPSQGDYDYVTGIWDVGDLANGNTATLTIQATLIYTSGTITNTAEVTAANQSDPNSANNQASVDITVPAADLNVTMTVSDGPYLQAGYAIYYITLSNGGPDAATGIQITDALPAGVIYFIDTTSQGSYNNATGVWDVGTLTNGASATLDIMVAITADPGTYITNTAEVTAVDQADPYSANNQASVDITVSIPTP